ncbi:glycosyltransferase family 4 protein [Paenibacillus oenotherae]|uniref:Glycosyltransferase family 4 protein n=1 Tax=Paenibacillus oenotherae TaxID=1435645 RepID=A0ABS7D2V4_9BACL|nr:glycosyltransferase family 4 protein [Paenibacillus oenotherae]MBW7474265.1 glycosyltransferase family 4 protein [Paenibacillus oenotherae]
MHVVWAHDHTFYFNETGKFYSGGKLPYAVWERYLSVFDRVTVACRGQKTGASADMAGKTLSSGPNVDFLVLPSLSNPVNKLTKRGYVEQSLTEVIRGADAVIARMPSEIGSEAIRVARQLGKPYSIEMVACAWDGLWNYGSAQGKLYAPLALWKTRRLVRRAPYGIYVTEQFLQQRYPLASSGVQGSCSNVEIPIPAESVLEERLQRITSTMLENGSLTPFRIGLIGSLNGRTKGIETALRAIARIAKGLTPFELHILGDGSPERWQALAARLGVKELVTFHGVLPSGSAVFQWLDGLDLYIQPSFQEGLPRATIEAMSRACPVIASTAGGIPELIGAEWLHKPGNDKQLANLLANAIGNKAWMAEQAEANFARAKQYTKAKLDHKRMTFWQSFRDYVASKGASPDARAKAGHKGYASNDSKGVGAL